MCFGLESRITSGKIGHWIYSVYPVVNSKSIEQHPSEVVSRRAPFMKQFVIERVEKNGKSWKQGKSACKDRPRRTEWRRSYRKLCPLTANLRASVDVEDVISKLKCATPLHIILIICDDP